MLDLLLSQREPLRILCLGAHCDEDLAARATAMAIGPVAYFMKPFDDEKFIGAVRNALKQN